MSARDFTLARLLFLYRENDAGLSPNRKRTHSEFASSEKGIELHAVGPDEAAEIGKLAAVGQLTVTIFTQVSFFPSILCFRAKLARIGRTPMIRTPP